MLVTPLALREGSAALDALPDLARALDGDGPLLVPHAHGTPLPVSTALAQGVPDDAAIAIGTSGSTGRPKLAVLTAAALRASAEATHEVLGGPGVWLLTLPPHHIAGLQVLLRSMAAGHTPVALERHSRFSAPHLADAVARARRQAPRARRYTSLVPTQLVRLLSSREGVEALRGLDGILVGGAATSRDALDRARAHELPVVTTYGMSETCGGCVYDGCPLPGVRVRLENGRVHLGGALLAHGYLDDGRLTDGGVFTTDSAGIRWFRTDDLGHFFEAHGARAHSVDSVGADSADSVSADSVNSADSTSDTGVPHAARLVLDGRIDDVVITGGLKVLPRDVERALESLLPEGAHVVVVGVPDPEWGHCVGAVFVPRPSGHPDTTGTAVSRLAARLPQLLEAACSVLPLHAVPRRVAVAETMPLRGPGKPDRAALLRLLADEPRLPTVSPR